MLELMFQDKKIASIDMESGDTKFYSEPLPLDLNFIIFQASMKDKIKNIMAFYNWCAGRTLMMNQAHAKKICNALALSQENSVENKAAIALSYHCCTLLDGYWVKKDTEKLSYNQVSLFQNESKNILTPISLKGKDIILNKKLKNWCDIGVDGTLAKSWVRENGRYYLYKAGDNVDNEILASNVLETLNLPHVTYEKEIDKDQLKMSKCKCFTNKDLSFIPYRTYLKGFQHNSLSFIKRDFLTEYANLAIATYLTGNEDLHDKNWGVIMDNKTQQITGLAPLFDFDGCFIHYTTSKDLKFLPECNYLLEDDSIKTYLDWTEAMDADYEIIGPTIEEAALNLVSYCSIDFQNLSITLPEKYQKEFDRRIGLLINKQFSFFKDIEEPSITKE